MFDSLKGMAGMAGLLKDLPKIKAKIEEVKERLGEITVDAETGGGAVRAVVDGKLSLREIHIEPGLLAGLVDVSNPDDHAMAEDLITGAVNAAMTKARERAEREMMHAAEELDLPIPPGALGGMMH
ncbi:MAG: YbaB/EbfC family nucleoid-associated protein [Phycisphaerales bacterium]|nr:YbaB/EbfC family nucleoid-associated protein [Phycisphaerales bacterium]